MRYLGSAFGAVIGVIFGNLFKEVRADEKSSIDFRNYFFDFDIYRRWICSYKSWAGKCRICGCTGNLDYNMFWFFPPKLVFKADKPLIDFLLTYNNPKEKAFPIMNAGIK